MTDQPGGYSKPETGHRENEPLLLGQQIRLVDQQQALPDTPLLLVPHTDPDLGDVRLQILASESDGVTTIDDLDDQVRSLNDSPELTPDLQVSLERGQ